MFYLPCCTVKGSVFFALREKSYLLDFSYFFALTSKVLVCNRDN